MGKEPDPLRSAGAATMRSGSWPAISFEERSWNPSGGAPVPHRARLRHVGPYLAAVPATIAAIGDLGLSESTRSLTEEASAEIARFDGELGRDLAPFSALLLRSESAASSRIERLTASAKAIALAELGDPSRRNAAVIVANTRAMEAAIALADRLGAQAVLDMHSALLGESRPEWVGHWRDQAVWIGGSDYGPHGAVFVPPHHDRLVGLMDDLVAFMSRDDLSVFAQAAIAHAQFETIHPFPDGNGRTGRALIHSLLRAKGLTRNVTVPVSAGLLVDTNSYFDALTDYRDGNPAAIVERLAHAAFRSVANGRELVDDLRKIEADWSERLSARRGAAAWQIVDRLTVTPVVDGPMLQRALGLSQPTVSHAIDVLVEAHILAKVSGNHRNRKWAASDVFVALDAFAERAGRRVAGG